ncbi:dihydroorotase [Ammonifex thiophilus]|uniref:Dihydroorotase n=1 Tax=Ammonifex thiophilus TaxID=444093 RepID=A0A3D8P3C5_9THEO|nr:dihydroorotase [Ammonifex thiophilus]RDV81676.1 dihydroorotase [Ammonifex thiophilus]
MKRILFKSGTLVDPSSGRVWQADLLVEEGRIKAIDSGLVPPRGTEVVNAGGCLIFPGCVDVHVHLREPGFEHKETIATGVRAAVRGGFVAVAAMPNTRPVADSAAVVGYVRARGEEEGLAQVFPVGALSRGSEGKEMAPLGEMRQAGAVAFSDDGRWLADAQLMRRVMEYARMLKAPVISHCEEPALTKGGVMNEGITATVLGLRGMPAAAEEIAVARDIILAEFTGCHLHVAHISTAGAVRLVREARSRGLKVTAEVTPHHFTLTEEAVQGYNTNAKVNPPLRTRADVEALREALADGTIDIIATDHAPHAREEKEVEFDQAPFGISGLETAIALVFTELVHKGVLDLPQAAAKLSLNPRRLLGLPGGVLAEGEPAELTLIDPEREEEVDPATFASKGRNTPFAGWRLKGWPVGVVVRGKWIPVRPLPGEGLREI